MRIAIYLFLISLGTLLACKTQQAIPSKSNVQAYPAESEIVIPTVDSILISGTLRYVNADKLMIIIAGSGATDRDCNAPGLKSDAFKMLADTLHQLGISTYRYDKRGIGQSTKVSEENSSLYDRIDDVTHISQFFEPQFSEIFLFGHSEGALVASVASQKEHIKGCIIASGISVTIDKVILQQTAQYTKLTPILEKHFEEIRNGEQLSDIHPIAQTLIRPTLVPYYKSAMSLEPSIEIAQLNKPALVIGGHCDIQVPVTHAKELHEAAPLSDLLLIDGMGHVMKTLESDCSNARAAYGDPSISINSKLVNGIVNFLR